jgi:hypothetical protein
MSQRYFQKIKKGMFNNLLLILAGILMIIFGWLFYRYDLPEYKFLDFLSKYITASGILIAVLAYVATTRKDTADENRSKSAIAFDIINQWQILPFTDYRKDIFYMEKINEITKNLINNQSAGDFAKLLTDANYAHYRSSLVCVLNFFEHIAISIERNVVDEKYLKDFFKTIFIEYQELYSFYIAFERKKEADLWIKFSTLAHYWRNDYNNLKS